MDSVWYEALVIIISCLLIVILGISIFVLVMIAKISSSVKRITDKTEDIVDRAEQIGSFFEKTTVASAVVKLVSNISETFSPKKGRKK